MVRGEVKSELETWSSSSLSITLFKPDNLLINIKEVP